MEIQLLKNKCRIFNWVDNYEDEKVSDISVNGNISNNVIVFIIGKHYYCYDLEDLLLVIKNELDGNIDTNQYIQGDKIDNQHYYIDRGIDNNGFRIYENNYNEYEGHKERVLTSFYTIFSCIFKLDDFIQNIIFNKRNTFIITSNNIKYIVGNNKIGNKCNVTKIHILNPVDRSIIKLYENDSENINVNGLRNYSICPINDLSEFNEIDIVFKKLDIYKQSLFHFELEKYKYKNFVIDKNKNYEINNSVLYCSEEDKKRFKIVRNYFIKFQNNLILDFETYIIKLLSKKYIAILEEFISIEFKDVESDDENNIVDTTAFNRKFGAMYDIQMRNNEIESECSICFDSLYPDDKKEQQKLYTTICCGNTFHYKCIKKLIPFNCPMCRRILDNLIHIRLYFRNGNLLQIPNLSMYTHITELYLCRNKISDISPLSNLTNLEFLDLRENKISDISPLSNLTNLEFLDLRENKISDISPLSNLTQLIELHLQYTQISDISPLSNLTQLIELHLQYNEISDISYLAHLSNLKTLVLNNNKISDISYLSNLSELKILILNNNKISDISSLSNLTQLIELHLHHNNISNISYLSNLIGLRIIKISIGFNLLIPDIKKLKIQLPQTKISML